MEEDGSRTTQKSEQYICPPGTPTHMVEVPVSNEKLLSFRGDLVESHRHQGDRESKVGAVQTASGAPPAKDVQQVARSVWRTEVVTPMTLSCQGQTTGSTPYLEN